MVFRICSLADRCYYCRKELSKTQGMKMNKTKALLVVLAHVAVAAYVIFSVWPALKVGSEDRYNTKSAGVIVNQPAATEEVEVAEVIETAPVIVEEVATEQVEVIDAVTETVAVVEEQAAAAQVHIVTAQVLKYAPLVINIAVGDTVAWENMSSHDTQAMEGLAPEGTELWHSAMGDNFQRTFTQEGIYIYKCTPHFGAGMGGVIIVGKPVNLAAIKAVAVKGAAKRLVKKAIKAADAM